MGLLQIEGIVLLSLGSIIVITGLALAFGDVAASLANAVISSSLFSGDGIFFGGGGGGGPSGCNPLSPLFYIFSIFFNSIYILFLFFLFV